MANPGDWGIDVLVGNPNGQVTARQAKYFINGVGHGQRQQISKSFTTAAAKAAENGYTLERWVLCIPASMDPRTTQWWQAWKAGQEAATGVVIDLWDETTLRELLLLPKAGHVLRHYYEPAAHPGWLTPRHAALGVLGIAVASGLCGKPDRCPPGGDACAYDAPRRNRPM